MASASGLSSPFKAASSMVSGSCGQAPQLTKQSKLAEVIEGILGRELNTKELQGGFDLEDLIDKECSILVLQSKSKTGAVYSNVERVFNT
jgi:hypothetical protein